MIQMPTMGDVFLGMISKGHHTVPTEKIAIQANDLTEKILAIIEEREIDKENLIIVIGETHPQITQRLFQAEFITALNRKIGPLVAMIESSLSRQEFYDANAVPGDFNATLQKWWESKFRPTHRVLKEACLQSQNIPLHAVDNTSNLNAGDDFVHDRLPELYKETYKAIPELTKIFNDNPELFKAGGANSSSLSKKGMIKRNLIMATRIDSLLTAGPAVITTGLYHCADPAYPDETSLTEILLYMNYDIIFVALKEEGDTDTAKFEKSHSAMCSRLSLDIKRFYHAYFNLTLPSREIAYKEHRNTHMRTWNELIDQQGENTNLSSFRVITDNFKTS